MCLLEDFLNQLYINFTFTLSSTLNKLGKNKMILFLAGKSSKYFINLYLAVFLYPSYELVLKT